MESPYLLPHEHENKLRLLSDEYGDESDYDALDNGALPPGTFSEKAWSRLHSRRRFSYNSGIFHQSWSTIRHNVTRFFARKCVWRGLAKSVVFAIVTFLVASFCHAILNPSYSNPPQRYQDLADRVTSSTSSGRGNVRNEKVFIAANILNEDLIRGQWGQSLLELIDLLGDQNVFVSIYENDSGPGPRNALLDLQHQFSCNSSVVTGEHVPLSLFPTVSLPNGEQRVQRLTYLAEIRNRMLRPLDPSFSDNLNSGFRSVSNIKFDKILFLNDVYFSPLDAIQLLFSTNAESGEAQYRAACAIDFVQFFKFYDTFVVRDTDGYPLSLQYYPWFTHVGSGDSRADVMSQSDAVRVRSCWGGMAAFNATVFQPDFTDKTSIQTTALAPTSMGLPGLPTHFRGAGEPFWEAAECCLVFADLEHQFGTASIDDGSGVFINPYIRTAYSSLTWRWLPFFRRYDRFTEYFQWLTGHLKYPEHNPRRLHQPGQMVDELVWQSSTSDEETTSTGLRSRTHQDLVATEHFDKGRSHFDIVHRKAEPGGFCGQRRLFVMKTDLEAANAGQSGKNWENVRIPSGAFQ